MSLLLIIGQYKRLAKVIFYILVKAYRYYSWSCVRLAVTRENICYIKKNKNILTFYERVCILGVHHLSRTLRHCLISLWMMRKKRDDTGGSYDLRSSRIWVMLKWKASGSGTGMFPQGLLFIVFWSQQMLTLNEQEASKLVRMNYLTISWSCSDHNPRVE